MNRFTLRIAFFFIPLLAFCTVPALKAQDVQAGKEDISKVENYQEQIKRLLGFLEFSLNTLGDPETSTREKEVIVNESYTKAFLSDKVQVEDDLDENREILTYKDVQAYLKDVDFFFRKAEFRFDIQDIQSLKNTEGMMFFKVTANRNLTGVTVEDEKVSNNKVRYIEINLDDEEQVLKIASIYTTRLNEAEELRIWWNGMPRAWKDFLGSDQVIMDSIKLSDVDFLNDSTLLRVNNIPETIEKEGYIYIGNDSLLVFEKDTILAEIYDTIPATRNIGVRGLNEIAKRDNLDISGNPYITDLYPVDQMSELKTLDISGTLITDLFPARNLTKLVTLNISGTGISDLAPIKYNTRIKDLYLDSTMVSSLEPVSGFSSLEILHFSGSRIEDLNPVRGLPLVTDLKMDNTPVTDLSPLADLPALESLSISGTRVDSLNALQYMLSLKRLAFGNTSISDLTPLARLDSLAIIFADQSQISDLSPLGEITSLEKVYCDRTGITRSHANTFMAAHPNVLVIYESKGLSDWWNGLNFDWKKVFYSYVTLDAQPTREQLHQITMISKLDITGNNNITSLEPLAILTNLREIRADGTYISDVAALSELTELRVLTCSGTRVSSLLPLQAINLLEELDVSDTPVDSLDGLNGMINLKILNVDRTAVSDLSPLISNNAIKIIYCDNTKIGKADIDRFLDRHPDCLIIYQTTLLKNWWIGLPEPWKAIFKAHTKVDDPPGREQLQMVADLKELKLAGNREVSTLEPLKTLSRLENLDISNGVHQDISPLSGLVRLKRLNLSGNPISDLEPIGDLPMLNQLDISNTPVERLDDLENLSSLENLNCSGTQIKKLDPLIFLAGLKRLECYNTGISSLKPLLELYQLKFLSCYNTRLTGKKVEAYKAVMPGVEVVFY